MEGASSLSKRGEEMTGSENLLGIGYEKCSSNVYEVVTNPTGCINLGTSENRLVFDLLKERLDGYNVKWEDYMFTYCHFQGIPELREAVAGFLTNRAKALSPIDPEKIVIMNGGGVCMEALALAVCDEGDGVMVASPYYGGINNDVTLRPKCTVVQVHCYSKLDEPDQTEPFQVTMGRFEKAYQEATAKGVKIRAVYFMNPNNPLGDVCTKEEVLDVLNFCHRHSLHLIMNEVYMNSIFKEGVQHYSVLGLKPEEIPDPERLHFVWAASKDMSMSGMRFGVVYTQSEEVKACLNTMTYFHLIPVYIQKLMAKLLSDKEWLDNVYFPTNLERLRESHKVVTEALDEMKVPYLNRPSGLYVYADFRKYMSALTRDVEMDLFLRFIEGGVYIAPSLAFFADERGWFRIIFSRSIGEVKLAMERLAKTCREILEENKNASVVAAGGDQTCKAVAPSPSAQGNSLESLMASLKSEISKSDWLTENTADQWKSENPDLFKEYVANMKQ